jgi:zinc and cadmium transporter
MIVIFSLFAALSVMVASMAGVLFTSRYVSLWINARLTYLATFSAGVLSVLVFHLVEESLHGADTLLIAALPIVCGFLALEILHRLIPGDHHHHESTDHTHSDVDGRRVLLSDSVHNITDGFLIVSSFIADWRIGIGATIGILVHEVVQEVSEFFVLRHAGYSSARALVLNFLSSSTILIGVGLALFFARAEHLLSVLTGLAAGGFLSVVTRDLVPSAIRAARDGGTWMKHITAFIVGCAVMTTISLLAPHADETHTETLESHSQSAREIDHNRTT